MNVKIIGMISVAVVIGGGLFFMTIDKANEQGGIIDQNDSACADVCRKASQACPSLINEGNCNAKCSNLSEEAKRHLEESDTCEEISSRPDLIADLIIPEINTPEPVGSSSDDGCEAACGSYVSKCLTLVPNATQALFEEGQASCMEACAGWDSGKVDCMVTAFDCEAMTEVCGL